MVRYVFIEGPSCISGLFHAMEACRTEASQSLSRRPWVLSHLCRCRIRATGMANGLYLVLRSEHTSYARCASVTRRSDRRDSPQEDTCAQHRCAHDVFAPSRASREGRCSHDVFARRVRTLMGVTRKTVELHLLIQRISGDAQDSRALRHIPISLAQHA